jgi:hypothetical protein
MGWLKKKLKAAAKWAWRVVKAAARIVLRLAVTGWGLFLGIPDLLFGFLLPAKKLRIQIYMLADATHVPATQAQVQPSIDFAKLTFKKRFNVKLLPYGPTWMETIDVDVPKAALEVNCGFTGYKEEWGEAGEFFNQHLAGWNATPVSGTFPVTVFIVSKIEGKSGCSYGPLTDYVTVEVAGLAGHDPSTMAHEIGHACNLWHSFGQSNLMYKHSTRGDTVHWWQKNLFRSSRHATWW